jgi:phage shock protein A
MDDIELLLERARDKMLSTQARAEAVNELLDTGVLGRLGAGGIDALESQVRTQAIADSVDQRLAAMKQELGLAAGDSPARLEAPEAKQRAPKRGRSRKA